MRHTRPRRYRTYTKQKMDLIINVALIDMQFPFILALMGRNQIAETMGGLIATEIVGIFLVYCVKSFFETKEEEKVRMMEEINNEKMNEEEQEGSESEENYE